MDVKNLQAVCVLESKTVFKGSPLTSAIWRPPHLQKPAHFHILDTV